MKNKKTFVSVVALAFSVSACASDPASSMREGSVVSPIEAKESTPRPPPEPPSGRSFDQEHRWDLTDPVAIKALSNTPFGEQEIIEYWSRKGWHNTQKEDRFNATLEQLVQEQKIKKGSHWAQSPFTPTYVALETITIEGVSIPKSTEFWMDTNENEDQIKVGHPLFARANGYQEEHQGHIDQASDARDGQRRPGTEGH